jgi:hypothetical protein
MRGQARETIAAARRRPLAPSTCDDLSDTRPMLNGYFMELDMPIVQIGGTLLQASGKPGLAAPGMRA